MKTIGERIRYFRKERQLTQDKLAELTGIHPVSIRKYETNKMQPQLEQIERIASVLDVNASAIIGYNSMLTYPKTKGDLIGVFMMLFKNRVMMLVGPPKITIEDMRKKDFDPLQGVDPKNTVMMFNLSMTNYFHMINLESWKTGKFDVDKVGLASTGVQISDEAWASDFIFWAALYTYCEQYFSPLSQKDGKKPPDESVIKRMEELEMKLLADTTPLFSSGRPDGTPVFITFGSIGKQK